MSITHPFVSTIPDSTDATLIQPSNWNAAHSISTPSGISTSRLGVLLGLDDGASKISFVGVQAASKLQQLRRKANTLAETYEFFSPYQLFSGDYNFSGVSIAQTLTSGITNTITLPYGILGIAGTNVEHYIRINDGVGTSEAVKITGGTATSGVAGTITFVPANNHTSGNWTLETATAGIQEAVAIGQTAGGAQIILPSGISHTYQAITVSAEHIYIRGQGRENSSILTSHASASIVAFSFASLKQFNGLEGCTLGPFTGARSAGYAITLLNQGYIVIKDLYITATGSGISITSAAGWSLISEVAMRELLATTGIGIYANDGSGVMLYHVTADHSANIYSNLHIVNASEFVVLECDFVHAIYNLLVDPAAATVASLDVIGTYFDTSGTYGIWITPGVGGVVTRCRFTHCWTNSAGNTGVQIDTAFGGLNYGITFYNHYASLNTSLGMGVNGSTVGFGLFNSTCAQNGADGVYIGAAVSQVTLSGNKIGAMDGLTGNVGYGIKLVAGAGDHILINGNDLRSNTVGAISNLATGTDLIITNNLGVDSATPVTVASATTISLGVTAQPIYYITGTTTITTINTGWKGRQIVLIKTDAGSATVGGGGNIPGSHTLAQYGRVSLLYDGSNWY